jgi:hypothetical protein
MNIDESDGFEGLISCLGIDVRWGCGIRFLLVSVDVYGLCSENVSYNLSLASKHF